MSRYPGKGKFVPFPSCAELRRFALDDPSWMATAWMYGVSNKPHGGMHSGPGGTVGLAAASSHLAALMGAEAAASVRQHTLWRFRVLDFPAACPPSAPPRECAAACNWDLWTAEEIG